MHKIFNNKSSIIYTAIFAFGLLLVLGFALRLWIPVLLLLGVITFSIYYFTVKKLNLLMTVVLMLSFAPKSIFICYPVMLMTAAYIYIEDILSRKISIRFDLISLAWIMICILACITVYKWKFYFIGFQWFLALAFLPLLNYLIVDKFTEKEILWMFKKGLPIIAVTIVGFTFIKILIMLLNQDYLVNIHNIVNFRRISVGNNGGNRLAGVLVFISLLGFTSYPLSKGFWFKNVILQITYFSGLLFSFAMMSRASILSLAITCILGILIYFKKQRSKINYSNIVVMSIFLIIVILSLQPFWSTIVYRMKIVKIDYSSLYRLYLWYTSILIIISNPVLGAGPGQYPFKVMTETHEDPHNFILRYGVDLGAISIVILLIIIAYPFWGLYKIYKKSENQGLVLLFLFGLPALYIITHSMMDYIITSRGFSPFFWFFWSLFIVIVNKPKLREVIYERYIISSNNFNLFINNKLID